MLWGGGLKGLCRRCCLPGIDLVLGTQTSQRSARRPEHGSQHRRIGKSLGIDGLDSAGFKKTLRKRRARREVGGGAEVGEENFWPGTLLVQNFIRPVTQALESRRQPHT